MTLNNKDSIKFADYNIYKVQFVEQNISLIISKDH